MSCVFGESGAFAQLYCAPEGWIKLFSQATDTPVGADSPREFWRGKKETQFIENLVKIMFYLFLFLFF